jgi:Protein of unknown function (DUF3987)
MEDSMSDNIQKRKIPDAGILEPCPKEDSSTEFNCSPQVSNGKVAEIATSAIPDDDFIPDSVFENLPSILKEACGLFNDKYERDVFLYGTLTVLGGSFHNLLAFNDVDKKKVATNLLSIIVAPSGNGKGTLTFSKKLIKDIRITFAANSRKLGSKEELKMLLPANISASGLIELLFKTKGIGIMLESEIDTLVNANKQDWGNYSDVLRNSFENESCSLYRKADRNLSEIENVKLSLAISGTPYQFKSLIGSPENGLFSRGCYYVFSNTNPKLKCFDRINTTLDLDDQFGKLSEKLNEYYEQHLNYDNIRVVFNKRQLTLIQDQLQQEFDDIIGIEELRANVIRTFIIVQKVGALLTFLENCEVGSLSENMRCSENALQVALNFALTSLKHSYKVHELLPKKSLPGVSNTQQKLFHSLPEEFSRSEALSKATIFGVNPKTIDNCIRVYKSKNMIQVVAHGKFKKIV